MSATPDDSAIPDDYAEVARPSGCLHDAELTRRQFGQWLAERLPAAAEPRVDHVEIPEHSGMSNETVLVDATWAGDDGRAEHRLVLRVAPLPTAVPVFPSYDLDRQYRIVRAVAEHSSVPVPPLYWFEPSDAVLGGEFFVMGRVDGEVPPDMMPYNFGSWLSEAGPGERGRLQRASVRVLADLHGIAEPARVFGFLADAAPTDGVSALRTHIDGQREYYRWVTRTGPRSPLIERCFAWIDANLPAVLPTIPEPPVLSWGDARIGNIIYRDFAAAAVLDWEMAALGPRELDLGWMIFLHRFFEDIAHSAGLPGMPGFLRRDDVCAYYAELTGHVPRDMDFYTFYAALRHAIIMFRIQARAVAFGQAQQPDDPDDMIMHRAALEKMLAGEYWGAVATADGVG